MYIHIDEEVRLCVLTLLDEKYDAHLAQAENLTTLFVAMHDEVCKCMYSTVAIISSAKFSVHIYMLQ